MLALYWGSKESRQAIMDGYRVSEGDVQVMLKNLTNTELDVVEKLWAFNDRYWPEFSAVNTRMFGATPPKVAPVPFEVNGRKMTGGYMRLYYRQSSKDAKRQDLHEEAGAKTMSGAGTLAMTKAGSANERVGSGGRMPRLDPQSIGRAVEETIHAIAFSEVARSINQIISNESVAEAISRKHSPEAYQSLWDNLYAIFAGESPPASALMQFMRYVRTNLTYAHLAYSLRNFIQQPTGIFNVFGKVGEMETIRSVLEFARSPVSTIEEVDSKSAFMRNRTAFVNREAAEILGKIETRKTAGLIKQYAFAHQTFGDMLVAYPAWLAGYRQGMAKFGDETKAAAHADDIVAATIGSGMAKDMSPMLHGTGLLGSKGAGGELSKQFTFMGSFFNVIFNLVTESYQTNDLKSVKGAANFARQMGWYIAVPAIVSKLLISSLPGEDDDESIWEWAFKAVGQYGLGTVFFVRDVASYLQGFSPQIPYQTAVSQLGRMINETVELFAEDDEFDASDAIAMSRALQPWVPLPGSGQIIRSADYLQSYQQGDEGEFSAYDALIEGKERDK